MKKVTMIAATLLLAATTAIAATFTSCDDDKPITIDKLPAAAQTFIKENFAREQVSYVTVDRGLILDEYTVVFVSGTKLDFDNSGEWTEVDCRYSAVPNSIVPKQISEYVKAHHPNSEIIELKREHNRWEAKITGGLELTFNSSFAVIEIDD
ncbi:MAG: PepSY-like domain-containing protein [Alistipes sp.]|nr:PepSY-like domain-containing protein [Alistipes sp.]